MTDLAEKIKIMQAAADGEEIELRFKKTNRPWVISDGDLVWNWDDYHYRIKVKPRVFYVNDYGDSLGNRHESLEDAKRGATKNSRVIRFVEDMSFNGEDE